MWRASKQHLEQNNERYFEHQRFALRYAFDCFSAGLMAAMHGLVPAFFQTSASEKVKQLAARQRKEDAE